MKNILVIEDNDTVISQITTLFNSDNYNLLYAEQGATGYELALKNLPDLIICSNEIYDAFDNEMLHKLREDTIESGTPFIFLIDKNAIRKTSKASNTGADYYIIKPFTSAEFNKIATLALQKYESVIQKSQKKLEELRGALSFALPHEFFTPLNGILGFTDILINEYASLSRDEMVQMLQFIHKDALRLKKLTENFLAYAQLEIVSKDQEKLNAIRTGYFINPKEVIETTAAQCAKEFDRENDIVLELDNGAIRMAEGYLRKILQELINNALKFSEKGSPVIVSLLSNDTSVMIAISDCGVGMTPKQVASIGAYMQFNRKQQEQQGSGLGLIIAKKITELHNGQFTIESTPGDGTKISLIFEN